MRNRVSKKTSAPARSTERRDLRPQNENRPLGLFVGERRPLQQGAEALVANRIGVDERPSRTALDKHVHAMKISRSTIET
jgi:hypothetical protein